MTKKASVFNTKPSGISQNITNLDEPIRISEDKFGSLALFCEAKDFCVPMSVDLHLLFVSQIGMFPVLKNIFFDKFFIFMMKIVYSR